MCGAGSFALLVTILKGSPPITGIQRVCFIQRLAPDRQYFLNSKTGYQRLHCVFACRFWLACALVLIVIVCFSATTPVVQFHTPLYGFISASLTFSEKVRYKLVSNGACDLWRCSSTPACRRQRYCMRTDVGWAQ